MRSLLACCTMSNWQADCQHQFALICSAVHHACCCWQGSWILRCNHSLKHFWKAIGSQWDSASPGQIVEMLMTDVEWMSTTVGNWHGNTKSSPPTPSCLCSSVKHTVFLSFGCLPFAWFMVHVWSHVSISFGVIGESIQLCYDSITHCLLRSCVSK